MLIERLDITEYDTPDGPWHSEVIQRPTWEAIEAAITRLDRCYFPFVCLFCDSEVREGNIPDFQVIGGDGAYSVVCRTNESEHWLQNPSGGAELIDVWISDQGTSIPARSVSTSLQEVLAVARHFSFHREPDPKSRWASNSSAPPIG